MERPGRHTSEGLEMSRRDCTGVPYETVQQNDGKWEDAGGMERERAF